ncbi:MAG: YhbY family RNA-binding protein [Candidatus Thermoplasmatota archaeon]|nr:YhbY family RNA-binding protein [Candidatus Thermoplasmatota archaeon]MEC9124862.1 YhbY family RNA-binding protein [Candidatus Thermoplasmatota archaeon]
MEGFTGIPEAIEISEIKVPRAVMEAAKSRDLQTTIRVGKGGLSESVVNEVREQLDSKPLVKIKLNRGVAGEKYARLGIIAEIEEKTNSHAIFVRGNVAVLWRR